MALTEMSKTNKEERSLMTILSVSSALKYGNKVIILLTSIVVICHLTTLSSVKRQTLCCSLALDASSSVSVTTFLLLQSGVCNLVYLRYIYVRALHTLLHPISEVVLTTLSICPSLYPPFCQSIRAF